MQNFYDHWYKLTYYQYWWNPDLGTAVQKKPLWLFLSWRYSLSSSTTHPLVFRHVTWQKTLRSTHPYAWRNQRKLPRRFLFWCYFLFFWRLVKDLFWRSLFLINFNLLLFPDVALLKKVLEIFSVFVVYFSFKGKWETSLFR